MTFTKGKSRLHCLLSKGVVSESGLFYQLQKEHDELHEAKLQSRSAQQRGTKPGN